MSTDEYIPKFPKGSSMKKKAGAANKKAKANPPQPVKNSKSSKKR